MAVGHQTTYTSNSRFSQRHDQRPAIHLSDPRGWSDEPSHLYGEAWTWKFSPSVFKRDNARGEWLEFGPRLVGAPGRKAILPGERSLLFTEDPRDYVRELGGTDIPIVAIPEARHHLMLDQPLAFTAALCALLAEWTKCSGQIGSVTAP